LHKHQYIKLDISGFRPEQTVECLASRIKGEDTLLRPLGIPLEGEGDNKGYLTQGKEEGELPRRWSLWNQTDPVSLHKGRVVEGQTEFAASYNDRVFLFESEENQKEFCTSPKTFLQKAPEMPGCFRLLISGPSGSGRKTVAQELSKKYGWKIADWNEIVSGKFTEMRSRDEADHLPNNPLAETYGLGLSENEWNLAKEGKPLDPITLLPWFYEHMGYECEKRRPPPIPEGEGEGEMDEETKARLEEEKRKEEEKKKKEEKERKKKEKAKKKKKGEDVDDEGEGEGEEGEGEEPLEDIDVAELDLKVEDEETLK
jgi:YHS domain-containing protein